MEKSIAFLSATKTLRHKETQRVTTKILIFIEQRMIKLIFILNCSLSNCQIVFNSFFLPVIE